jgi:hypothetical protein
MLYFSLGMERLNRYYVVSTKFLMMLKCKLVLMNVASELYARYLRLHFIIFVSFGVFLIEF